MKKKIPPRSVPRPRASALGGDPYSGIAGGVATHTHVEADITDLGTYAVVGHTHVEADITDLQAYALIGGDDFTGDVSINVGANLTTFLTLGEGVTARGTAQDSKLIMWGEGAASAMTKFIFHASGPNFGLSSSGSGAFQMTVNNETNSGKYLRVRDATNSDWGQFAHTGVHFTLTCTNTSNFIISGANLKLANLVGFNNTEPISKPIVTGSRGGNVALASLLTALANYGLVTNSST